eukprot:gene19881-39425_t
MLRHLLGADWVPGRVVFPHACKGRRTAYEDWFQAPVVFGSGSQVRIHMQRAALGSPLRAAHFAGDIPGLSKAAAKVGTVRLGASETRTAVDRIIRSSLPDGPATLQQAAEILGQSARTIHFICAGLIVTFIVVHVVLVLISGVWNNLRSMVTGKPAMTHVTNRRRWLTAAGASLSALWLTACDKLTVDPKFADMLRKAEGLTLKAQRLVTDRKALAKEFTAEHISNDFRANGTRSPTDEDYVALRDGNFAAYKLVVDGLVERPLELSLADINAEPSRTQITRHDCVEGWSAIGQWTGPQLAPILKAAGLRDGARYIVFLCADGDGGEGSIGGLESASRDYES